MLDRITKAELNTLEIIKLALGSSDGDNGNIDAKLHELSGDWNEIKSELAVQTIIGLPVDVVLKLDIADKEKEEYFYYVARKVKKVYNILNAQKELCEVLKDIPFVIIKGGAASMYYPKPEYRQMGDIDVIVAPEFWDRAVSLLNEHGYKQGDDNGRHVHFKTKYGFEIELHRFFVSERNNVNHVIFNQMIQDAVARRENGQVCGYNFPVLPKLENGLVLLGHIRQHLDAGLGLRQILDWMMYVKANLDDDYWNTEFAKTAEAVHLKTLAQTVTLLCKEYLGLDGVAWCDGADRELVDELLEYILRKGNFGRKQVEGANATVTVMHYFRNPVSAFKYLHAGGMIHWEAAKKHKFLRPFAWIYQIGHLLRKGLARKKGINTFVGEMKQSKNEVDFLRRLGIMD
ncbi:MAG: nucleotidyltransferase family protein [Lachnospiraceae bacterium]|nr:nucleotidyltransferase family protein [Lachnospiraceae bacterium]